MENTTKPLREIIDKARKESEDEMETWKRRGYVTMRVAPPDMLALTDQIKMINELAPEMALPMSLINRIATTMSTSEDTEQSVIGQVLVQCHAEIKSLTDFCRSLATKDVVYPLQDVVNEDE